MTLGIAAAVSLFTSCSSVRTGLGDIEESADNPLRAMSAKLSAAQHLTVSATRTVDAALSPNSKVKRNSRVTVKLSRPDGVAAKSQDDSGTRVLFYDGSSMTIVDWQGKLYASVPVSGDIDGMIDQVEDRWGVTPALADLLVADPYESLPQGADTGRNLGTVSVGGHSCDHLRFVQPGVDWEIWISRKDSLPRRFEITFKDIDGQPKLRSDIHSWDLTTAHSPDDFVARAPKGSQKIEMIPMD